jgi:hypothetical protein
MTTFYVRWQTSTAPGLTFYSGTDKVEASNMYEAQDKAISDVWRRMFPDRPRSHILVVGVSTIKPQRQEDDYEAS